MLLYMARSKKAKDCPFNFCGSRTYLIAELKKSGEHGKNQTTDQDVEYSRHVAEQAAILP